MFRLVELPNGIIGKLFLHGMPGRYEPFTTAHKQILHSQISRVVCLASLAEIGLKSPYYADAIRQNDLPWIHLPFPIPDYGVPDDREAFLELVQDLVSFLQSGENVLIHCGAGIGRTGMVAICILLVAGLSESDARDRVRVSGSGPERPEQNEVVRWVAQQISRNR